MQNLKNLCLMSSSSPSFRAYVIRIIKYAIGVDIETIRVPEEEKSSAHVLKKVLIFAIRIHGMWAERCVGSSI